MRKGVVRIILGSYLIVLQILSSLGNLLNGFHYQISSLSELFGLFLYGICGAILLVFGIKAYNSREEAKLILHNDQKILKYVFGLLILLVLIISVFSSLSDIALLLATSDVLYIFSAVSMLIYLIKYQGRKPSFLFAASTILVGSALFVFSVEKIFNIYVFFSSAEFNSTMMVISLLIQMLSGVIYTIMGILIYYEKKSVRLIKVLGGIAFVSITLVEISSDAMIGSYRIDTGDVMRITIFVYSCLAPRNAINKEEEEVAWKKIY